MGLMQNCTFSSTTSELYYIVAKVAGFCLWQPGAFTTLLQQCCKSAGKAISALSNIVVGSKPQYSAGDDATKLC